MPGFCVPGFWVPGFWVAGGASADTTGPSVTALSEASRSGCGAAVFFAARLRVVFFTGAGASAAAGRVSSTGSASGCATVFLATRLAAVFFVVRLAAAFFTGAGAGSAAAASDWVLTAGSAGATCALAFLTVRLRVVLTGAADCSVGAEAAGSAAWFSSFGSFSSM